jgi:hypothetical protein
MRIMSGSSVDVVSMNSSPNSTTKGLSPTCLRATDTAWPSPSGDDLAHEVDVGELGEVDHLVELRPACPTR